jgi:anaerobic ribonucleoside-triphosphate reductase
MNDEMFSELVIVKRSGQRVNFNGTKIALAIKSAFDSVYDESEAPSINKVYEKVLKNIYDNYKDRKTINVEDIQDIIENELQNLGFTKVYESFNTYRLRRAASRESFSVKQQHKFVKAMEKLALTAKKDVNSSPHDTLYDFGKIISNQFTKSYLLDYKYVRSHDEGNIYIKGLDYYALGTSKSSILDFSKIKVNDYYLDYLRRLIINIKSEEYGEQSIPDIDFLLEEYALNIFKKIFKDNLGYSLELFGILDYLDFNNISDEIDMLDKIEFDNKIFIKYIKSKRALELFNKSYDYALKEYLKHLESKLYIFFNALNLNNNHLP